MPPRGHRDAAEPRGPRERVYHRGGAYLPADARGRGQTTEQLEGLEPGMTYIVHTRSMAVYVRHLVADRIPQVRPLSVVVCATAEDAAHLLRGTRIRAVADHACPDEVRWAVDQHTRNVPRSDGL